MTLAATRSHSLTFFFESAKSLSMFLERRKRECGTRVSLQYDPYNHPAPISSEPEQYLSPQTSFVFSKCVSSSLLPGLLPSEAPLAASRALARNVSSA